MSDALIVAIFGGVFVTCSLGWFVAARQQQQQNRALSDRLRRDSVRKEDLVGSGKTLTFKSNRYSSLPILRRLLSRSILTNHLMLFLEQSGTKMNVGSFIMIQVVCFFVAVALFIERAGGFAFVIGIAAMAIPWFSLSVQRQKRLNKFSEQLPDAIRLMTSALRAGLGLNSGLDIVATELPDPIRSEFRKLLNEWRLYSDINEAFTRFSRRLPMPDACLFAASACLHREVGGNFAELLDQLELTIRSRFELKRELRTMTAESKFSGWILGFLPMAVGGGLMLLNPEYFEILLDNSAGRVLLYAALGMQLLGFFFIHMLTHPKIR